MAPWKENPINLKTQESCRHRGKSLSYELLKIKFVQRLPPRGLDFCGFLVDTLHDHPQISNMKSFSHVDPGSSLKLV